MICPVCNHEDTKVIDTRPSADGLSVRRRRECPKCEYRFSTYEQTELLGVTVVKRNGSKEAYSREKLSAGINRSLEKRPYTTERFQQLISRIERDIQRLKGSEVTARQIGEIVMQHLKRFDKVAYVRFASVYRAFEDVETFQEEVKSLIQKPKKRKKH